MKEEEKEKEEKERERECIMGERGTIDARRGRSNNRSNKTAPDLVPAGRAFEK